MSNLADGIFKTALPLVAVQFTRSPALIAGLTVALTLPWLLFALHAGALADRLDRRRAMLGANCFRAAVLATLTLAVLLNIGSIWVLYVVALCIGVAETIYDTSTQSVTPQLVRREQLSRANGRLYAAELTGNQFVGPPLAGFLTAVGAATAFVTPAGLWVVAVIALLFVPGSFRIEGRHPTTMRADIVEGLRFLWRSRLLRTLALMTGMFSFASNAMMAVFVLYAVGPESAMRLSAPAYGMLLMTTAVGSLVGSFVAEWIERVLGRAHSLVLAVLGATLLVGVPAVTAEPFIIGVAFFLGGTGIVIWNVVVVSLRQRIIPDRLLGRLNGSYRLLAWGPGPLGAAAGGLLAELLGLRTVFALMALLSLTMLIGTRVATDKNMDAAEREVGHS